MPDTATVQAVLRGCTATDSCQTAAATTDVGGDSTPVGVLAAEAIVNSSRPARRYAENVLALVGLWHMGGHKVRELLV